MDPDTEGFSDIDLELLSGDSQNADLLEQQRQLSVMENIQAVRFDSVKAAEKYKDTQVEIVEEYSKDSNSN